MLRLRLLQLSCNRFQSGGYGLQRRTWDASVRMFLDTPARTRPACLSLGRVPPQPIFLGWGDPWTMSL